MAVAIKNHPERWLRQIQQEIRVYHQGNTAFQRYSDKLGISIINRFLHRQLIF